MYIESKDLKYTVEDMASAMRDALGSIVSKYGIEDDLIHMCLLYPLPEDCTDFTTFIECPPTVWIRDYAEMEDKYFYQNATVFASDFSDVLHAVEQVLGLEDHNIIPEKMLIHQLGQAAINCVVNYVNGMLEDENTFVTCLPRRKEWEKKELQRAVRDYLDRYTWGNEYKLSSDNGLYKERPHIRISVTDTPVRDWTDELYPWTVNEFEDVPF